MIVIKANRCGQKAYHEILKSQEGEVIGNTSRGIFIHMKSNWIVFLSSERFLNPLNINLIPFPPALRETKIHEKVQITEVGIFFPDLELRIQVPSEKVYSLKAKSSVQIKRAEQKRILGQIAVEITEKIKPSDFVIGLQAFLFGAPDQKSDLNTLTRFQSLSLATQKQDSEQIIAVIRGFIGEGSGLTPAGDDLVCGYLLACNRWNPRHWSTDYLASLNESIISYAHQKTTTLAANLIEISTRGEADERLVTSLDSIFTGEPLPEKAAKLLISYGSSSGVDAFCGMVLAIK